MLSDYVDKILMLYNLIDDVCIVDKDGIIVHADSFQTEAYSFDTSKIIGKHFSEVYTNTDMNNSTLYKVLESKTPIFKLKTSWKTYKGDEVEGVVDTLPIFENGEFTGVIEIASFTDKKIRRESINLSHESMYPKGDDHYTLDDIISSDEQIYALKKKIGKIAQSDSGVLIHGETGTGKEMIAQAIHYKSSRSKMPFISQNCAAIPGPLLESLLFGTEKGGFTDAESRKGLFEIANGGTLFLDEINSMDLSNQSKILKVVEEQKILRIGGQRYIPTNVRIICALNEDPMQAVKKKHIREDLFYRLSAVILSIPPLRQRKDDIPLLVSAFIKKYATVFENPITGIDEEAMSLLCEYDWPGNVRELKNVIEGAFNLSDNKQISKSDIPEYILNSINAKEDIINNLDDISSLDKQIEEFEKKQIIKTIQKSKNKAEAAKQLNISRQLLNYKINKYKIEEHIS